MTKVRNLSEEELAELERWIDERVGPDALNDYVHAAAAEIRSLRETIREMTAIAESRKESPVPIPMLLWCPECGHRHIDVGEFETKVHHTHACQNCGHVWRPAIGATTGVKFLPGFKNSSEQ